MTNLLKVLESVDQADLKGLEKIIPSTLLKELDLQTDGTVHLETLLKICHRANRLDEFESRKKGNLDQPAVNSPNFLDFKMFARMKAKRPKSFF